MSKIIAICSDGTTNTFGMPDDEHATNVSHLVHQLLLDEPEHQLVFYGQGVGSVEKAINPEFLKRCPGLSFLDSPPKWAVGTRVGGQLIGTGLEKKVLDILSRLANVYEPGDMVMLFGFSRGAFTVRAVAGMLHRFGLPSRDSTQLEDRLRRCWKLYRLLEPNPRQTAEIVALRAQHRTIRVHFLGLFDTVKAYGGLWPVRLPHLRHNPIVDNVRHAVAIHEHRAWFAETTWGRLDIDEKDGGPMSKLEGDDLMCVLAQDIKEIWFCGYHADIGSGKIALRWILAEAVAATPALLLSEAGRALLDDEDPKPATGRDSMRPWWWVAEWIPRAEIFNDREYARRAFRWPSHGKREPTNKRRDGLIHIHESARNCASLPPPVETWPTL